jgi:glucokinase
VDYLKAQVRFENLSEQEIEEAQVLVNNGYKKLEDAVQQYLAVAG